MSALRQLVGKDAALGSTWLMQLLLVVHLIRHLHLLLFSDCCKLRLELIVLIRHETAAVLVVLLLVYRHYLNYNI